MRKSNLAHFDTNRLQRDLFRKKSRLGRYLWLAAMVTAGVLLFQTGQDIPDLLLDGFKFFAHMVPNRHTGIH